MDRIVIESLELRARIGVTDRERAEPQRLTASLILEPRTAFNTVHDKIERTVDYADICVVTQKVASLSSRRLLESLAEDIASELFRRFSLRSVELELRKYSLAETRFVAVRIQRSSAQIS